MRFHPEHDIVRDVEAHRVARFLTAAEARESADWLNSGDTAADPEAFIWRSA